MMSSKKIIVLLTRAPWGRVHFSEGFRAALGLLSGFEDHQVTVVLVEDAVFGARRRTRISRSVRYIKEIIGFEDSGIFVDEDSLLPRGIAAEELRKGFQLKVRSDMIKILREADHILHF